MASLTTLLLRPATTLRPQAHLSSLSSTLSHVSSLSVARKATKDAAEKTTTTSSSLELAAIVGGLLSNLVIGVSPYTLKTRGCGLPRGPGGSISAAEGVSYRVVAGIVSWSVYTKVKTGFGLPNGPYGLLGAIEGLSYLTVLAIAVIFGLPFVERGYIPGPLLADQSFS